MIPQKYHKPLEFACYLVAIFLFAPFIISIILGSFAIGVNEKLTVTKYFILVGELFIDSLPNHILATILIIIGIIVKQKYK